MAHWPWLAVAPGSGLAARRRQQATTPETHQLTAEYQSCSRLIRPSQTDRLVIARPCFITLTGVLAGPGKIIDWGDGHPSTLV